MMKKIFVKTLSLCLFMSLGASLASADCFDPRRDPEIRSVLSPKSEYGETAATINQIHSLIWSHRHQIDPRLIYYRMIGESLGRPHIVNPRSGAYGLFQFLGSPYRSRLTHRQLLEQRYRRQPGVSPRLIQVEYYLTQYLQTAIRAADGGYGCNRSKDFSEYTNMEKVTYLGWGACNRNTFQAERSLCTNVATYRDSACSIAQDLIENDNPLPLCGQ